MTDKPLDAAAQNAADIRQTRRWFGIIGRFVAAVLAVQCAIEVANADFGPDGICYAIFAAALFWFTFRK